ncbi:MAG: MFS transporter [Deltaproteobacteria bacterium]|nr:MFS transporter [Deltaproteobacteria bacterium]
MSSYGWFTAGATSWFTAWGMNGLVFSWLVVNVLETEARWVGLAQSSTMLPALGLLLFGGAVADRFDPRRLLIGLHLAATLPMLALAVAIEAGALSLTLLIGYGLMLGTFSAFVMPSRDALLSRVAGNDMMRAVTGMTAFQFGGQAVGSMIGGATESVGVVAILALQALVLAAGAAATLRVAEGQPSTRPSEARSALHQILEGIRIVWGTPNLRTPVVLVFLVGVLFIGPYMVLFPLLVRDHYGGGSFELALLFVTFPLGTIAGSLILRVLGGVRRMGRALLLSLASGAVTLVVMAVGLSFPQMVGAAVIWGLCGAVFINTSRTLVQEAAPAEALGRVLAAYQVGIMGGSPLGALLSGIAAERFGPLATLRVAGVTMLVIITVVAIFTDARKME